MLEVSMSSIEDPAAHATEGRLDRLKPSASAIHVNEHQVAERLGIDVTTLRTWRRTGCGPSYRKFGKSAVRYWLPDIVAFEEAATRRSTSDPGHAAEPSK
jgi:hypothetical protein